MWRARVDNEKGIQNVYCRSICAVVTQRFFVIHDEPGKNWCLHRDFYLATEEAKRIQSDCTEWILSRSQPARFVCMNDVSGISIHRIRFYVIKVLV